MKKIAFLLMLGSMSFGASAQTVDTKKVSDMVAQKNYVSALAELNNLKKQIQTLASSDLLQALPKSIGEYAQQPLDLMGSDNSGGLNLRLSYLKPRDPNKDAAASGAAPQTPAPAGGPAIGMMPAPPSPVMPGMTAEMTNSIIVSLSTNMTMAGDLMRAHSGEEIPGAPAGSGSLEALRIKGYRALLKNDSFSGPTGQIVIGGAFIQATARGEKDTKLVKAFLEAIDTDKLKAIVGE